MHQRLPQITTLVAIFAALLVTAAPATARIPDRPGTVQAQIDDYLARHPGGKPINSYEIAYDGGRFIVGFAQPGYTTMGADCTSGWYCFYEYPNYVWPRGRLSDCGWQDLARWYWQNRVDSAYYNMTIGSVVFIRHGAYSDHSADVGLFTIGTGQRGRPDAYPYRNQADHVYRYCS